MGEGTNGRQLRLALAMRGGVSLAVWIGGAVAEIDLLRRVAQVPATPSGDAPALEDVADDPQALERARLYRALLHRAGYDDVVVDVLAGASAGGLNAVVYGYAQALGLPMDWLLGVWERDGDLWDLLRPTRPPRGQPVLSLLDGDGRFFPTVREALTAGAQLRGDDDALARRRRLAARHLSVDLSATVLDPQAESTLSPGGLDRGRTRGRRHTAGFSFRRRPAPLTSAFTDLPGRFDVAGPVPADDGPVRHSLARLALAARSTSSFPGAFEPATVVTAADPDVAAAQGLPSMRGVFSETSEERPSLVVDGGVFDNIPIARALEAIQGAPAQTPTARTLLYLDPSPPLRGGLPQPLSRTATGFLPVVLRTVGLRQRQEDADDEVALVRRHNEDELAARGRHDVLATLLAGAAVDPDPLRARYRAWRASVDTTRLGRLLTAPAATLLRSTVVPPQTPVLTADAALRLRDVVPAVYGGRPLPDVPVVGGLAEALDELLPGDATALESVTGVLIAWLRALEDTGLDPASAAELSPAKARLYRLRELAGEVRARGEAHLVETFLGACADSPPDWAAFGENRLAALRREREVRCAGAADLAAALDAEVDRDWAGFSHREGRAGAAVAMIEEPEFYPWLERVLSDDGDGGEPLLDLAWDQAEELRQVVAATAPGAAPLPLPPGRWWESSIYPVLASDVAATLSLRDLAAVLAAAGGAPGTTSTVRFRRLTSDRPVAAGVPGDRLAADEVRRRVTALLRTGAPVGSPVLAQQVAAYAGLERTGASAKLAGNQLANFAGFLDRGWRRHDWTWGRADAAGALVDLLTDEAALTTAMRGAAPAPWPDDVDVPPDPATAVQASVLRGAGGGDAPKPVLAELHPAFRYAVVARVVHLLWRGVWPFVPPRTRVSFPAVVRAVLLVLLRPLLVLAPLAARPAALAAALAAVVVAGVPGRAERLAEGAGDTAGTAWLGTALLLVAVSGFVTTVRAADATTRWQAVVAAWSLAAPADADLLHRWHRARRRWVAAGGLLGTALALAGAASTAMLVRDAGATTSRLSAGWLPVLLVAAGAVLAAHSVLRTARSAPREAGPSAGRARRERVLLAAAALALLAGCVPGLLDGVLPDGGAGRAVVLAACAAVVVALAHHGWAVRWALPPAAAVAAVAAALAGLLVDVDGAAVVALVAGVVTAFSTGVVPARVTPPGRRALVADPGAGVTPERLDADPRGGPASSVRRTVPAPAAVTDVRDGVGRVGA